jgi:hypothetical protein
MIWRRNRLHNLVGETTSAPVGLGDWFGLLLIATYGSVLARLFEQWMTDPDIVRILVPRSPFTPRLDETP